MTSFFWTGLNEQFKQLVPLSLYGLRGKSMDFSELVFTKTGSSFTVGEVRLGRNSQQSRSPWAQSPSSTLPHLPWSQSQSPLQTQNLSQPAHHKTGANARQGPSSWRRSPQSKSVQPYSSQSPSQLPRLTRCARANILV